MRVTHSVPSRRRHKKVLKRAKGFWDGRRRLYSVAHHATNRAMAFQFRDRKVRKRDFRRLWIVRLSAAVRPLGLSYSRFVDALTKAGVALDRKVLSDIAVTDATTFAAIVRSLGARA